ncbi:zf-HC2 domain-containing protein [Thermodesulfobacteriota bacterium]
MNTEYNRCNPALLNRFLDQEVGADEKERVKQHVNTCPICQKVIKDNRSLTHIFKTYLDQTVSDTDTGVAEEKIAALFRQKKTGWWTQFQNAYRVNIRLVPLTAMVAALVICLSLIKHNINESGPSAIINSFAGNVSSVIFLETKNTHQTIIWFDDTNSSNRHG